MPVGRVFIGGAAAVALGWSARESKALAVTRREEQVFRRFNDAPDFLSPVLWAPMQAGSLAAVFLASELTRRRFGRDAALTVALTGTAVWGGVKLIKPLVGRGRPAAHLGDVNVHGQEQRGLGYPSGHAAVSLTLAVATTRAPGVRVVAVAVAAIAGASRMYVGAHLPLDVVGGFAIGALAGTTAAAVLTAI
ncbi:MAG: phosphatase PAP2 family protein [Acidimicrobiia bacterium]|nr:phosphatase PAP2 family protein [Acidimicrobiia bacterium]